MDDAHHVLHAHATATEACSSGVSRIGIFLEGEGLPGVELVELETGATVAAIIQFAAAKGGYHVTEALVFVEDEPDPISPELLLSDGYHHRGRKHHVHRSRSVDVVVHYTSRSIERDYGPSTRAEAVLAWALKEFGIDPSIAPEFELAVMGSSEELPGARHIGGLVRHGHRLELNLIRGCIQNGASDA